MYLQLQITSSCKELSQPGNVYPDSLKHDLTKRPCVGTKVEVENRCPGAQMFVFRMELVTWKG
jgi:hypothetical protein